MPHALRIEPYKPIPLSIVAPEKSMDEVLESFLEKYGVIWIAGKRYVYKEKSSSNNNEEESIVRKRKRTVLHIWYKTFFCHRSGDKAKNMSHTPGGTSGQIRPIQKNTKKKWISSNNESHLL